MFAMAFALTDEGGAPAADVASMGTVKVAHSGKDETETVSGQQILDALYSKFER